MPRTIIIGDIHGCAKELELLLEKVAPTNEDRVVSLGDVTDKGPHSRESLGILIDVGATMVRGNHDDRYIQYHKKGLSATDVNKKKIKEDYKKEYAKLAGTPELAWMAANATIYSEININNVLYTFTHAGAVPYINLYDMDPRHIGEAIRVRYLDADNHRFVRIVWDDKIASWSPEHDNVVEWQHVYKTEYGILVHGHIIVGPNPIIWVANHDTTTSKLEVDRYGKNNKFKVDIYSFIKAISLDTGAYKGWNLTAMVLDDDETVYFEQVEASICYGP